MTLGGGEVLHLSLILQDDVTSVSLTEIKWGSGDIPSIQIHDFLTLSVTEVQ